MNDFNTIFKDDIALINEELNKLMLADSFCGESSTGFNLMNEAMAYSLKNGGKRIRPVLALEFCKLFGGTAEQAVPGACALEMIHTYSLIHDDLPCMDDDALRRGKPSNHIVYGYANALLAGDALLTYAFEILSKAGVLSCEQRCESIVSLSAAAGAKGMVAGQVMDLENEEKRVDIDTLKNTDLRKTGCLIRTAGELGCIAACAGKEQKLAADEYCRNLGLAFQIVDDILDVTSTTESLGKPVGSDAENSKSTYVSLLGLSEARRIAAELTEKAKNAVKEYKNSEFLVNLADELCGRKN